MIALSVEKENEFSCKECGSLFPTELTELLLKGESIFCENCGTENIKKDFDELQITQKIQQKKSKNLVGIFSSARESVKKKSKQVKKRIKKVIKD